MTPAQRENLKRLLNPRHVAIVGGRDAEIALKACQTIGFNNPIWVVNPRREVMAGLPCYASIDELPEAPDAVFLAIPAQPAIEVVKHLSKTGAGGIVCYTAGFGDDGHEGGEADRELVDAAGDCALIGPNCYGLINYIEKVSLWPFAHGGYCPGYGAAIITQSGMLSSDITMNQRTVPLAYMISAGNQSVLQLEDYIDVLCERDEVKAIGLHIEGLKDISAFSQVAYKALEFNKPIVVLKTGTSKIGSQLTISHTGSLSGTNELYQALFERLGIISVINPAQMLETLKFICVAGIPTGKKMMGFTCSGGGATMLADYAENIDLGLPSPSTQVTEELKNKLPAIADVTNPLDYTTPIWGQSEKVQPVFEAAMQDHYDVAMIVQDYPLQEVDESKPYYLSDLKSFIIATSRAGVPAALCSTLSENIDQQTREYAVEKGIAPLQGIHDALDAVNNAAWYHRQRKRCLNQGQIELVAPVVYAGVFQCDEWVSKTELAAAGFSIPRFCLATVEQAQHSASQIGFPVVIKMNSDKIAHKTEAGAIKLGINNVIEVEHSVKQIQANVNSVNPALLTDQFIVEQMLLKPVAELMVNIRHDDQFGLAMTLSSGGILVELIGDAVTLILPATKTDIVSALEKLKVSHLLNGYRGQPAVDQHKLVSCIKQLADYVIFNSARIAELEINPLFVYTDQIYIVDVFMQQHEQK